MSDSSVLAPAFAVDLPVLEPCKLVHRSVATFNARRLDALLALMCDDGEIRPLRPAARSVYRGRAAIARLFAELAAEGREEQIVVEQTHELSESRIVALGRLETCAGDSPVAVISELRDGRIAATKHYFSDRRLLLRLGMLS